MYKTAAELGIQQWERDGLEAAIADLTTMSHATNEVLNSETTGAHFNMNYAGTKQFDCGTVMCIGGLCYLKHVGADLTKLDMVETSEVGTYVAKATGALRDLYYPLEDHETLIVKDWNKLTPADAIQAIKNYLTTADANWEDIIPEENTQSIELK